LRAPNWSLSGHCASPGRARPQPQRPSCLAQHNDHKWWSPSVLAGCYGGHWQPLMDIHPLAMDGPIPQSTGTSRIAHMLTPIKTLATITRRCTALQVASAAVNRHGAHSQRGQTQTSPPSCESAHSGLPPVWLTEWKPSCGSGQVHSAPTKGPATAGHVGVCRSSWRRSSRCCARDFRPARLDLKPMACPRCRAQMCPSIVGPEHTASV
jgi:hypothetical protein